MRKNNLKIGLALSGGGMRAILFHLGVLKFLAEKKLLEKVVHISSVSGGSILVGLVYTNNNMRWTTSNEYLERVLPSLERLILSEDIEKRLVLKSFLDIPHIMNTKNEKLASTIKTFWNVKGELGEIPVSPLWSINAVTYETGKRFVFSQKRCGEEGIGYFSGENMPIAQIISASSGFPLLIGMYELRREKYVWFDKNGDKKIEAPRGKIHLWDGGIYDNLGVEALFCEDTDTNFYILSDAGYIGREFVPYHRSFRCSRGLKRLLDIATNQVDNLTSKFYGNYIKKQNKGMVIKLMATYPTNLKRPTKEDFERLLREGYERAKSSYKNI